MAGRGEANFSAPTIRIIHNRASFQCIVPSCEAVTMGPGAASDQTASAGTACHIFSASPTGPRGRGGLTDAQLRGPENGVWACAFHGRLIDTNAGAAYPATLLKSWKALQEAQLKRERDGLPTRFGWLDRIDAQNTILFEHDAVLELGQLTLIQGSSLGKTALLDWISASLGARLPERWTLNKPLILTSLTAYLPEKRVIEAWIGEAGIAATVDKVPRAEIPTTVACIYIREGSRLWPDDEDDDVLLGRLLSVDPQVIRALIPDIQRCGTSWGRRFDFHREFRVVGYDDDDNEIRSTTEAEWVLRAGGPTGHSMRVLSGSESADLLIEFAASLARERSATTPTVLLLDGSEWPFDDVGMNMIGEYLATQPFQTIMTAVGGWNPRNVESWKEWKRYELQGSPGDAAIVPVPW